MADTASRHTDVALGARLPWPMTHRRGVAFMLGYAALLWGGAIVVMLVALAITPDGSLLGPLAPLAWFLAVRAVAHRVIMRHEPDDAALRAEEIRERRLAKIYS